MESERYRPIQPPDLAENIRRWRLSRGKTQSHLEQQAGLAHNAISRIETGAVSPKHETVQRIADALEISVEELHFRSPSMYVAEEPATYQVASLTDRLEQLPEHKRDAVLAAFHTLLEQIES